MKLEEIVPPPELCKKIPTGEFENSCFQWQEGCSENAEFVEAILRTPWEAKRCKHYPAPTVAEIMEKMPYSKLKRTSHAFFFERKHKSGAWAGGYNPAEIALQVWLKLKGIE